MTRAERDALRALIEPIIDAAGTGIPMDKSTIRALLDAADDRDAMKDEMRRDDRSFDRAVTKLNALRAVAEQMASAGRRLIGAVEACALADHGGPAVNWPAVDASQDAMRDAIRAWPIDGESMRHAKDREVIAVLPDFVPMIDEFTRAVTAIAKERDALRAVAEQAREALKETERLLSKAHDAMYGLPDGGSREGSEYPTREDRTEASWQLHYAHAVTRPALAALDTVLEPKAEYHE